MANTDTVVNIAMKIIKPAEGLCLVAYPDPASDLYKELSEHNLLRKFMTGELKYQDLPEHLSSLSGTPWTIGFGETKGIKPGMVWTELEAITALKVRVATFLSEVLKVSPKLDLEAPERIAAVVSLVYNIGTLNYKTSSVAKAIARGDWQAAGDAFLLWNKAGGKVLNGLVKRRQVEKDLFLSVRG